ncbi:MAG TPA: hypothetical protein VK061_01570 [Bacillota bacterium]|nr:hypothetical protein [Bacillota bacterium]
MKFIKQNSIYILIIFVILSVYADITTHNDVKTKNLCNAFHDETSRYTIVSYEVKDGDSVLSVMEDINKHKFHQQPIEQMIDDFLVMNPDANPYQLIPNKIYYFPIYN